MANEFELNSILSQFLDDSHEISSDFDLSSLAAKDVETAVNGKNHSPTPIAIH